MTICQYKWVYDPCFIGDRFPRIANNEPEPPTNQPTNQPTNNRSDMCWLHFGHRFRCIGTKILSLTRLKIKSGICLQKEWIYSRAAVNLGISRKTIRCNLKKWSLEKGNSVRNHSFWEPSVFTSAGMYRVCSWMTQWMFSIVDTRVACGLSLPRYQYSRDLRPHQSL